MGLWRLEFQSDNMIKSKAMKYIVIKVLPDYEWNRLILPKQCHGK